MTLNHVRREGQRRRQGREKDQDTAAKRTRIQNRQPKWLDYIGQHPKGKGSPSSELECSGGRCWEGLRVAYIGHTRWRKGFWETLVAKSTLIY